MPLHSASHSLSWAHISRLLYYKRHGVGHTTWPTGPCVVSPAVLQVLTEKRVNTEEEKEGQEGGILHKRIVPDPRSMLPLSLSTPVCSFTLRSPITFMVSGAPVCCVLAKNTPPGFEPCFPLMSNLAWEHYPSCCSKVLSTCAAS